jgi:enoyl-CoA hydratase/carnithine racemase
VHKPEYFLCKRDGPIVTITFNRPEKRNALDLRVMLELESLTHWVRDDSDIKCVIATGAGTAFCAGADLSLARGAATDEDRKRIASDMAQVPRVIGRLFDLMTHMDVISIAAVNGYAVGGGWSIALGFDHVVAAEDSAFWLPEVEIGQAFRGLANVKLTQQLGPALAREAMILCRRFSATELHRYGLINELCAADQLMGRARQVADAYLALPWRAVISTRREINATIFGPQHF